MLSDALGLPEEEVTWKAFVPKVSEAGRAIGLRLGEQELDRVREGGNHRRRRRRERERRKQSLPQMTATHRKLMPKATMKVMMSRMMML
jgi:hypothetical protein